MAGHRKRRDPSARWLERAAKAVTPDDQLAVAYDRLRALIADLRKNVRDSEARALRQREGRQRGRHRSETHARVVRPHRARGA